MAARTLTPADLLVLRNIPVAGRRPATVSEVKDWGRDNGFTVSDHQGRLANALVDAFNAAGSKGRASQKVQFVVGSDVPEAQTFPYTTASGRESTFTAPAKVVRAWAKDQGLPVGERGRFTAEVRNAYGQAHAPARKPRAAKV